MVISVDRKKYMMLKRPAGAEKQMLKKDIEGIYLAGMPVILYLHPLSEKAGGSSSRYGAGTDRNRQTGEMIFKVFRW